MKTESSFPKYVKHVKDGKMPPGGNSYLVALWYDGTGDWEQAHGIVQKIAVRQAAGIHAYLHRKEGDLWNADFRYRRAGMKRPDISLAEEWENLVRSFLESEV